jgi:hypothetical protein
MKILFINMTDMMTMLKELMTNILKENKELLKEKKGLVQWEDSIKENILMNKIISHLIIIIINQEKIIITTIDILKEPGPNPEEDLTMKIIIKIIPITTEIITMTLTENILIIKISKIIQGHWSWENSTSKKDKTLTNLNNNSKINNTKF